MSQQLRRVEAEVPSAFGPVMLVREQWSAPIDVTGSRPRHHLQFSLLPPSPTASGCFPEHWGPNRFEPMGALFLLPADQPLRARSDCRLQQAIVCQFDPDATDRWFDTHMEWTDRRLERSLDLASANVRALMTRIGAELREPGFASEAMIELLAGQVAIELSRYLGTIEDERAMGGLAPWRLRMIDEHLEQDCGGASLGGLAELCGMSVRHLTRAFRASRGRSIGEVIAERRIEEARRLLASGMAIKAVAGATGFKAPSNFTAAFRRATGESPKSYRERVALRGMLSDGGDLLH